MRMENNRKRLLLSFVCFLLLTVLCPVAQVSFFFPFLYLFFCLQFFTHTHTQIQAGTTYFQHQKAKRPHSVTFFFLFDRLQEQGSKDLFFSFLFLRGSPCFKGFMSPLCHFCGICNSQTNKQEKVVEEISTEGGKKNFFFLFLCSFLISSIFYSSFKQKTVSLNGKKKEKGKRKRGYKTFHMRVVYLFQGMIY